MTKPIKLAVGIGAAAVIAGLAAGLSPFPLDWLFAWASFSCFLVAAAYLLNQPEVLGKSAGKLSPLHRAAALPYLFALRIACEIMRRQRRHPPLSAVTSDLWVGGRFHPGELPSRVERIVDLVAEFSAPAALRVHPGYRSLPVLDGAIPPEEPAVLSLLDELVCVEGAILIHCDSGVGRAPTFAALVLLRLGAAADLESALALVRSARPMARPTSADLRFLERLAPRVIAAAEADAARREPARAGRAASA